MPIDAINTAMTAAQFSSAMSRARNVETADASLNRQSPGSSEPRFASPSRRARDSFLLPPATLHFTYSPIPGTSSARRHPQLSDTSFWSLSLNHLG